MCGFLVTFCFVLSLMPPVDELPALSVLRGDKPYLVRSLFISFARFSAPSIFSITTRAFVEFLILQGCTFCKILRLLILMPLQFLLLLLDCFLRVWFSYSTSSSSVISSRFRTSAISASFNPCFSTNNNGFS